MCGEKEREERRRGGEGKRRGERRGGRERRGEGGGSAPTLVVLLLEGRCVGSVGELCIVGGSARESIGHCIRLFVVKKKNSNDHKTFYSSISILFCFFLFLFLFLYTLS